MILGMNVLEFVIVAWLGTTAVAWSWDHGPEIVDEQKKAWRKTHPKAAKDPELTVTLPVGSFDPDTTMKLPRVEKKDELQDVIVLSKPTSHGRHAKV